MIKNLSILFIIGLFSTSCVQIPLGDSKTETYKNVEFKSPSDFSVLKASSSDEAWIKNSNGNIISYRTECPSDVRNLKSFAETLTTDFANAKITNESSFDYNNRRAYRFSFNAEIESIPTSYDLVLLKKYDCLFILTHNGRLNSLSKTASDFESFVQSFQVTQ